MQVIFSCEDSTYMWWQAELLHHSYVKTGMQWPLTAVVAANGPRERVYPCATHFVSDYRDQCADRPLVCLNKPGGLAEWAAQDPTSQETVLIVDTDSVFVRPLPEVGELAYGEAYSEEHEWMRVHHPSSQVVLERHCAPAARALVQPVGIYILINRACLAELAPLWLKKSVEIASDPVSCEALGGQGWVSEMWGYTIAAAELGVRHHIREFSQVTGTHSLERPIIHYCYPLLTEPARQWSQETEIPILWSKWHYQPWTAPPAASASVGEGRFLLEQLGELVERKWVEAGVEAGMRGVGAGS